MIRLMAKGIVVRLAKAVAALAVLGFVLPPMALAFAEARIAGHCLVVSQHLDPASHRHHHPAGVSKLERVDEVGLATIGAERPVERDGPTSDCCGLFCISLLSAPASPDLRHEWSGVAKSVSGGAGLLGRPTDTPDRPPRSSIPS